MPEIALTKLKNMPYLSIKAEQLLDPFLGKEDDINLQILNGIDFTPLVKNSIGLSLEYNILNTTLRKQLEVLLASQDTINADLEKQLITARKMAIIQASLYEYYLGITEEAQAFRKDEALYRTILNQRTSSNKVPLVDHWAESKPLKPSLTEPIFQRKYSLTVFARLFLIRSRRLLNAVRPLLNAEHGYHSTIKSIETVAAPFFDYLAWVFYLPRLINDVTFLVKSPPSAPLNTSIIRLSRAIRSQAIFERIWSEIVNDLGWLICGLLSCFVLLGPLLPVAAYLTAGFYVYDVLVSSIRCYIELHRLKELKKTYQREDIPQELQNALNARYYFERRSFIISISTATALSLAIALTVPLLLFNPLFPLIGAALLIAITLLAFTISEINRRTRPIAPPSPSATNRYQFFSNTQRAVRQEEEQEARNNFQSAT